MKLLIDQHFSYKLVSKLSTLFPLSSHVKFEGMEEDDDLPIWIFARDNGFTMLTKDADFHEIGLLRGYPPKIIWVRRGNCTTQAIEQMLTDNYDLIKDFIEHVDAVCLELY